MTLFIRKRERIQASKFSVSYECNDAPGAGFGFDCDKDGVVDTSSFSQAAMDNYNACVAGTNNTHLVGVVEYDMSYIEDAVIECEDCHRHVTLEDAVTNECECGALYNGFGQRLAPRSLWSDVDVDIPVYIVDHQTHQVADVIAADILDHAYERDTRDATYWRTNQTEATMETLEHDPNCRCPKCEGQPIEVGPCSRCGDLTPCIELDENGGKCGECAAAAQMQMERQENGAWGVLGHWFGDLTPIPMNDEQAIYLLDHKDVLTDAARKVVEEVESHYILGEDGVWRPKDQGNQLKGDVS